MRNGNWRNKNPSREMKRWKYKANGRRERET
jgi:hypothetical protein